MNFDGAKRLVAQKANLPLAQNVTLIETAILAALEEIGIYMTIAKALKDKTQSIAASTNYIVWATEYSRLVSVVYQYVSGASTYKRPLGKIDPTEYEVQNSGLQSQLTDYINHYCPRGDKIYVGPGNVETGGDLIVQFQRRLAPEDIEDLPNSSMIVWGGLANVLPIDNPEQEVYRRMFTAALKPASEAAGPTVEQYNQIAMHPQILADRAYVENL